MREVNSRTASLTFGVRAAGGGSRLPAPLHPSCPHPHTDRGLCRSLGVSIPRSCLRPPCPPIQHIKPLNQEVLGVQPARVQGDSLFSGGVACAPEWSGGSLAAAWQLPRAGPLRGDQAAHSPSALPPQQSPAEPSQGQDLDGALSDPGGRGRAARGRQGGGGGAGEAGRGKGEEAY